MAIEDELGSQREHFQLCLHRDALAAVLHAGAPWLDLQPDLRTLARGLLAAPGKSELPDLLLWNKHQMSVTFEVRLRPIDRLVVKAYPWRSPGHDAAHAVTSTDNHFELLDIAGFSTLSRSPQAFPGYHALSQHSAAQCQRVHKIVSELIALEVRNCQALVAATLPTTRPTSWLVLPHPLDLNPGQPAVDRRSTAHGAAQRDQANTQWS